MRSIMKKLIFFLLIIITFISCKKSESDFIWERTYGVGEAYFIKSSSDSGFYVCGKSDGNPHFIRFDKSRSTVIDIMPDLNGLFSSAWFDTAGYLTAGSSGGKMLLMRHSPNGNLLWEKTIDAGFYVDLTQILYTGSGSFLALASASPDSLNSGSTGLYFTRFDTTGSIISQKYIADANFVAAGSAVSDAAGNIYLALTRKTAAAKPKASVVKYNGLFQKMWETDLYNNPDFDAGSISVILDSQGDVYVTGLTGVAVEGGIKDNSFVAALSKDGAIKWKKYLEKSNSGVSLVFDEENYLLALNQNCFIVRKVSSSDGTDIDLIRPYSQCVSEDTDAIGRDFDLSYDKNYLLSGSKGGSFYIAVKSSLR
jgi:hypothetical protein